MRDAETYRRVCELFDAASDLDATARGAFLDEACRDDPTIRREVESLLGSLHGTRTDELFPPLVRAEEVETLAIGERIGPYTLRREIGAGGMGVVYEATREDVGKTVALKLARHGRLASPEQLRRFLLERRVLARLDHPNIARLLDAGVTGSGLPYLVMDYVDGEPIDVYCDARRLTVDERLALFGQICDAVHYAHRHLVVHRDLKPSNIAVTSDGVVKLLDFGIAALLAEGGEVADRLTRPGLVMLTPEYAAPEQLSGDTVTTASDVYALGLLLYELLAGRGPFSGYRSAPELLRAVCNDEPEPPSSIVRRGRDVTSSGGTTARVTADTIADARRTTPARLGRRLAGDLDTIVLAALRKEPERRYASALALRDDVDRHRSGRPVRARGDSVPYRARKFVRRHAAAVAATLLLVLSLAGGVVATAVQARRAERERAIAEQRFRDVRALAGALVADVHDAIADLPGSLPIRKTLVTAALEHLDRLHRQSADDPGLRREIAEAYVRLGLVQGNPTIANLGDLAAARRSFERALAISRTLVAADPSDHAARRTFALAHEKLSDADAWSGRLGEGVEHARGALEQWQSLSTAHPASVSDVRAVATSHVKLADLLGNPNLPSLGDRAAATREYERALALLEAVPRDSLDDWPTRRMLALVHERLGSMFALDGRHAEAIAEMERTLDIREGLVRERSASVDAQRDLAVAHQLLCEAQLAAERREAAVARCRRAVAMYETLRSSDPRNAQSVHDLALGLLSMHKALAASGRPAESLAPLDESRALLRGLLASDPDNVPVRHNLARTLLFAGTAHAMLASAQHGSATAEREAHRRNAVVAYDDGRRMLLELGERQPLTRRDSLLLDRARLALADATPRR